MVIYLRFLNHMVNGPGFGDIEKILILEGTKQAF